MTEGRRTEATMRIPAEQTIKVKSSGGSQPTIPIGYKGETLARKIIFDVSELITVFGDGAAIVLHQRKGDSSPYPCTVSRDGQKIIWELTEVDTAIKGTGMAQLQWFVGDTLIKSAVCQTVTLDALAAGIKEVPEAYKTWLESLIALAAETETNASNAEKYAALATEQAESNGYFYVEGVDGYLYYIHTDSITDLTLQDNGEGVLEAVYG